MAYQIDPTQGDIIIGGFQNGIGDSPYSGLTDVRNMNITSIPGEASVSFATSSLTQAPSYQGFTITAIGGNAVSITGLTAGIFLEQGQAVTISSSSISGLTSGTTVYIYAATKQTNISENMSFTSTYGGTSLTIGGSGTATLSTVDMVLGQRGAINKNYMAEDRNGYHYVAASDGRVWSDKITTSGGTNFASTTSWTYMGNTVDSASYGNGMVYLETVGTNGLDGWIFVWRQGQIDYLKIISNNTPIALASLVWVYAWKSNLTISVIYGTAAAYSHEALVTPFSNVAFCDGFTMGLFYQNNINTPFDPTNSATYSYFGGTSTGYDILSSNDIAQCCAYLGSSLLIGSSSNIVYSWDLKSNLPSTPLIQLPENDTRNIITVKNNAYIFCGNRGKIYITNGSQADFWAKVPDHLSGTVQPTFGWGATAYRNNQLYFGVFYSAFLFPNQNNTYGSLWGINLETEAIYISNTFSNNLTGGYCSGLLSQKLGEYSGNGLLIGWANYLSGSGTPSSSGVDIMLNTPYTGGQAYVVSDLIPIGTYLEPTTPAQFEYKLATPLLTNESVEIQVAPYFGSSYTSLGTTTGTTAKIILSDIFPNKIQNQQWLLVKAILTSTTSSPSFVRLVQIRIKGATVKDLVATAPYGIR